MTAEDIKRAADALRRMAQNGKGRQQMRVAQGRMIDVREMMKRGQNGQSGKGENGEGQDGEGGENGEGQEAGGDAEKQFEEGANGQLGQGMKPGGKGGDMLLLGGPKGGAGMKLPGMGGGQGKDPQLGQQVMASAKATTRTWAAARSPRWTSRPTRTSCPANTATTARPKRRSS